MRTRTLGPLLPAAVVVAIMIMYWIYRENESARSLIATSIGFTMRFLEGQTITTIFDGELGEPGRTSSPIPVQIPSHRHQEAHTKPTFAFTLFLPFL
jgi:hypothetical protein